MDGEYYRQTIDIELLYLLMNLVDGLFDNLLLYQGKDFHINDEAACFTVNVVKRDLDM